MVQRLPWTEYEVPAKPQPVSVDRLRITAAPDWREVAPPISRTWLRRVGPGHHRSSEFRRPLRKREKPKPREADPDWQPRRSERLGAKQRKDYCEQ